MTANRYILQLCHSYYDPFADCARQYAALFKNTPYKVITVFLSGEPDEAVTKLVDSDEVIFLGYQSKQLTGLKLKLIREIRKINQQYSFEFCIAHRIKPTYIALLATALPVVSVQHTFGCMNRWSRQLLMRLFESRLHILAVSDALRDEIRDRLPSFSTQHVSTLYNHLNIPTVSDELLSKTAARAALKLEESDWIIGNVGRLHPDKDQHTLLKSFAIALPELPKKTRLVIIGKGRLEEQLKALSVDLGIQNHVIFTGQVPQARRYFAAFDLFALTSDREPFGMVLLEAMAANVPIICADCGGGGEIVRPIGTLFPFADAERLAEIFIQFASKPQTLPDIRTYLAQTFSDEAIQSQFWQTIYPKLPKP